MRESFMMASNSINAFEGKLLEALNLLPNMGKKDRSEALRLFGQTAQFFHLQDEQQRQEEGEEEKMGKGGGEGEQLHSEVEEGNSAQISPSGSEILAARNFDVESVIDTVLDPTPADLFDDARLGREEIFIWMDIHSMIK